ncbi:P2Y purinoceptor 1-like isoform X1 [Gambusia affinis]|uniref:P2Y purinoceptor 1-like isoform X1 n=1 Tax=Gambusia affinis TaxID=33528 RepID=UPI001CDD4207|nr:P2Y purinoceptor 1-like isoform X1 [Gambusia affinis]
MNTTNCVTRHKDLFEHKILSALYIFVFVVGLLLNVWGIKSLLHNWKKLRIINILVLNLGLADMLYLLTLPFLIVYYLNESKWIFGEPFCKMTRFCFKLNLYGSIGFLTCISAYRYLGIVHPMRVKGRLTSTHSVVISVLVWISVSAQSIPDMMFPKHSENMTGQCYDTTDLKNVEKYLHYSLSWTFIGFFIPFVVTVGCYGHVTLVVCRSKTVKKNRKQQILKLMVLLLLLFSLCYAPYHVFRNLNLYSRVQFTREICPTWNSEVFIAHQASRGLVSLNSALNPLVYLNVNKDMSLQMKQLLYQGSQPFRRLLKSRSSTSPVSQSEEEAASSF